MSYLDQQLSSRPKAPQTSFNPSRLRYSGYNPSSASRTFTSPGGQQQSFAPSQSAAPSSTTAGFPERLNVGLPFGNPVILGAAPAPVLPEPSTRGDLLGSIGASIGSTVSNLNIGNVIPWLMDRVRSLARGVADSNKGNIVGSVASPLADSLDVFTGGLEAASNIIAPVIDGFPTAVRDAQLISRAKLYRQVAQGTQGNAGDWLTAISNPLSTVAQIALTPVTTAARQQQANIARYAPGSGFEDVARWFANGMWAPDIFGHGVNEQAADLAVYASLLDQSMPEDVRANAQKRTAAILATIDLPPSLKEALAANPAMTDEQVKDFLDNKAPEGKQWAYAPGLSNITGNWITPLVFYAAEAKAGMALGGAIGGAAAGSGIGAIATAGSVAARALPLAVRIQKAAVIAGLGTLPLTTAMDSIARYQGDQAAIDWWKRVNKPSSFADNYNVQLVTGFSVNPLEALKFLPKGILKLPGKAGNILLGKALGDRYLLLHTKEEALLTAVQKMYQLGSIDEARSFSAQYWPDRGKLFDHVVGRALKHVVDSLPKEERALFNARFPDGVERTKAAMSMHAGAVIDLIVNHPDELGRAVYQHDWAYHNYPGRFNAHVSAHNAVDFATAEERNYAIRERTGAVVGYQEHMGPEAIARATDFAQTHAAPDGSIALEGEQGLQGMIRMFPAMRKYWQGTVTPGADRVTAEQIAGMLDKASKDYAAAYKTNPVRVATGADPVLRPDSRTPVRDMAEALGTTEDVVRGMDASSPTPEQVSSLKSFLAEKADIPEAELAAMSDADVVARAAEYRDTTAAPWQDMGRIVQAAETRLASAREELAAIRNTPKSMVTQAHGERAALLETEVARLSQLLADAGDPLTPFAERVARTAADTRRVQRIRAMDPDHLRPDSVSRNGRTVPGDRAFLEDVLTSSHDSPFYGQSVPKSVTDRELWEQAVELTSDTAAVTARDVDLSRRAAAKVHAISVLDRIATIDLQIDTLGGAYFHSGNVSKMFSLDAYGRWIYTGGADVVPMGIINQMVRFLTARGHNWATDIPNWRQDDVKRVLFGSDYGPSIRSSLSRSQGRWYDTFRSAGGAGSSGVDEAADQAIRAGLASSVDDFEEKMAQLLDERQSVLREVGAPNDALALRTATRRADMAVPEYYMNRAVREVADASASSFMYSDAFIQQARDEAWRILESPRDLMPALREHVMASSELYRAASDVAAKFNTTIDNVVADPVYAPDLREAMFPPDLYPEGYKPRAPGSMAETELDQFIIDHKVGESAAPPIDLAAASAPEAPISVPAEDAAAAVRAGVERPSRTWRDELAKYEVDREASPNADVMNDPRNAEGMAVLSVLNHGVTGRQPATIGRVLDLLRILERGGGKRLGIGTRLHVEAARVAGELLRKSVIEAKRVPFRDHVFTTGLDPAMLEYDDWLLARDMRISEASSRGAGAMPMEGTGAALDRVVEMARPGASVTTVHRPDFLPAGTPMDVHVTTQGALDSIRGSGLRPGSDGVVHYWRAGGFSDDALRASIRDKVATDMARNRPDLQGMDPTQWPEADYEEFLRLTGAEGDAVVIGIRPGAASYTPNPASALEGAGMHDGGVIAPHDLFTRTPSGAWEAMAARPGVTTPGGEIARSFRISYDPSDPLGTLQYAFKRPPRKAVVLEMTQVPGLAEELMTGHFQPWTERVWTHQLRKAWGYVFGARPNSAIVSETKTRFIERLARLGVDGDTAEEVWMRWKKVSDESRSRSIIRNKETRVTQAVRADNARYPGIASIEGSNLQAHALDAITDLAAAKGGKGLMDPKYTDFLRTIRYDQVFQEASSNVRRFLADLGGSTAPGTPTLGRAMASAYGLARHNSVITSAYHLFRFGMDIRFHAMNFFEAQILYTGRAGLRAGEIDTGLLGESLERLKGLQEDALNNTGYAAGRSRMAYAYKTFLKEQPDALRGVVRATMRSDDQLMRDALLEMAQSEPQLASLLKDMGETPDAWLAAMDAWHGKMLDTARLSDLEGTVDDAFARQISAEPAMAEVYSRLAEANKQLWRDVRETFYGNPERSRAERLLNSYLLYWPISYQVKSAKWLTQVLFQRAGGLQTNAAGAVVLNHMAEEHKRLLATDPEYRDWFDKHKNMVFVASMLLPITPDSIGVSLSPIVRDLFFGRSKGLMEIGPVYTYNRVLMPLGRELKSDIYQSYGDIPLVSGAWAALTGSRLEDAAPSPTAAPAPSKTFSAP